MSTTPPQQHSPLTISLSQASQTLQSPTTRSTLANCLGQLSEKSIEDLGPLVFEVLKLPAETPKAELLTTMLKQRPEWIHQLENSHNLLSGALISNHLDLVDALVDAGVDPTYENKAGFSVLDFATAIVTDPQIQESCGNSLLRKGTCSSAQKDKALKNAARNGNLGMTRSLLAHGTGFSTTFPTGTALAHACDPIRDHHQMEIVRALLQAPGVDQVIDHGWGDMASPPAINRAAGEGNVRVVSLLLEAGALVNPPPDLRSSRCPTPLMAASASLHPEAIDLLIKSGAEANATDGFGYNALHHLATHVSWEDTPRERADRLQAMDLLVDAGVDPTQKDDDGLTPLDHAEQRGDPVAIKAFMALDARISSRRLASTTPDPVALRAPPSRRL